MFSMYKKQVFNAGVFLLMISLLTQVHSGWKLLLFNSVWCLDFQLFTGDKIF